MNFALETFWNTSWRLIASTPGWVSLSWWASDPAPTIEETIERLERVRQQVCDREKALRERMESHRDRALVFAEKKQVREARMEIRLRLLYDNQVLAVQKTLTAIESHLVAIQSASLNREVFLALHDSSRALGKGSIQDDDMVDDVLDKLDEQHDRSREIMNIISTQPLDASSLTDDDVDAELKTLMARKCDATTVATSEEIINDMPCVPQDAIHPERVLLEEEEE